MKTRGANAPKKTWLLFLCVGMLYMAGCSDGAVGIQNGSSDVKFDIYQATELALKHMKEENAIVSDYRLTCRQVDSEWVFWFEYLPAAPDNNFTVIVEAGGTIRMGP